MATDKNVNLNLKTKGDTKGAKQTKDAIKDVRLETERARKSLNAMSSNFKFMATTFLAVAKSVDKLTSLTDKMVTAQNVLNQTFGKTTDSVNDYIDNLARMTGISNTDIKNKTSLFGQMAVSLGMSTEKASEFSTALDDLSAKLSLLYNIDFNSSTKALLDAVKGESSTLTTLTGIVIKTQSLQNTLNELGINMIASNLTGANLALLQYITVAKEVNATNKDMQQIVNDVAWQKQILRNQVKELANAFGNLLYPILRAILPVLNGILIAITTIINALASLFGITKRSSNNIGGVTETFDNLGGSIAGATEKAKKSLRPFDKLNNIMTPTPTTGTGGGGGGLDPRLYGEAQRIADQMLKIKNRAQEIADEILKWLGFTKDVNGKWHLTEVTLGNVLVLAGLIYGAFRLISASLLGFSLEKLFTSFGTLASSGGLLGQFGKIGEGISLWLGGAGTFGEVLTGIILPALGTIAAIIGGIVALAFGILKIFEGIKELKLGDYFNGILDIIIGISAIVAGIALLLGGWVVAIVAGIVLVVAEIVKNWDKIKVILKKVGKWFNDNVIQPILDFIKPVTNWVYSNVIVPIVGFFTPIIDAVVRVYTKVWEIIKSIVSGVYEAIKSVISKVIEIYTKITEIFAALKWAFHEYIIKPIWDNFLQPLFQKIYNNVIQPILNVFKEIASFVNNIIIQPIWQAILWLKDKVVSIFKIIGTTVADFIGGSIKAVINGVLSLIEKTINNFIKMLNGAIKLINKIPGVNITRVSLLNIPRLENGGFVDSGQLFMARENGMNEMVGHIGRKTAVANNDQIVEAVASGVARANMMTKSNQKVEIIAEGDTSGLLDFITFKQKEKNRQYGF